jgi:hypothetical protein
MHEDDAHDAVRVLHREAADDVCTRSLTEGDASLDFEFVKNRVEVVSDLIESGEVSYVVGGSILLSGNAYMEEDGLVAHIVHGGMVYEPNERLMVGSDVVHGQDDGLSGALINVALHVDVEDTAVLGLHSYHREFVSHSCNFFVVVKIGIEASFFFGHRSLVSEELSADVKTIGTMS